jgi:hypothetical protein
MGDIFEVFTVEFDETEPEEGRDVESDLFSVFIVLEYYFME